MRIVIGLVGGVGSGKDEVSHRLQETGFAYYSLSGTIRQVLSSVGLPDDRNMMIAMGNSLRENFGGDILARGAKQWIEGTSYHKIVIDSIRNPAEVLFLRNELGALIVGVTMSPEKGFQLVRERNRLGDPQTWEEFQRLLRIERGEGQKDTGQQVQKCLYLADVILPNEGTITDLRERTDELLISRGIMPEGYYPYKERRM